MSATCVARTACAAARGGDGGGRPAAAQRGGREAGSCSARAGAAGAAGAARRDERERDRVSGLLLERKDAVSTLVGTLIGLSLFSSSPIDFFFGGSLFVVLLLLLSTPEVMDVELQYSSYKARHATGVAHALHAAVAWPKLLTMLVFVARFSSWTSLVAGAYAIYYLIAERSLVALGSALGVVLTYSLATRAVAAYGSAALELALAVHALCWAVQLASFRMNKPLSLSALLEAFIELVVVSPLLVAVEIAILCGFRKDFARRIQSNVSSIITERKLRSDSESSE
jgi:uncharacterized membrane protein YGL010W